LFGACKIAVQDFLGKSFFGTEMVGEGAQRNSSGFADIAHTRCRVARSKYHFEAVIEKVFSKGWLAHTDVIIRTYNDLLISEVLRTNELQVWFLSEHLVDVPLVRVKSAAAGAA